MTSGAARAHDSFNNRFWFADGGYLYDVVDCNGEKGTQDVSCRPNQIFAIFASITQFSIRSGGLPVIDLVQSKLLTPVGLRSLSPDDPEYKPIYSGDLRSRDGAYHQGTIWAWLIGPFIDAWSKVHPGDKAGARKLSRTLSGAHERTTGWNNQRSV